MVVTVAAVEECQHHPCDLTLTHSALDVIRCEVLALGCETEEAGFSLWATIREMAGLDLKQIFMMHLDKV